MENWINLIVCCVLCHSFFLDNDIDNCSSSVFIKYNDVSFFVFKFYEPVSPTNVKTNVRV